MKLADIKITEVMRNDAYFTFKNGHARTNANYPIAIEILKQTCDDGVRLFPWEIDKDIIDLASQINDILFMEYLQNLEKSNNRSKK